MTGGFLPPWFTPTLGLFWGLPGGAEPTRQCRRLKRLSLIPGWGRAPGGGNGNPLQYSCLKKIPWTEEPGGLQSMGSQRELLLHLTLKCLWIFGTSHFKKKKIYASQNSVTVWLSWVRDQLESYSQPSFLSSYPGVPTKTLSLTQEDKKKKRSQNEKCVEWLTGLLFETDEKPSVYLCKSLENHQVGWKPPWMDQSSGFENAPNSTISQTHFPSISTRAWTEKPGLQFMGSQRVRHDLATEQ